jgi:hypothetical protein
MQALRNPGEDARLAVFAGYAAALAASKSSNR